MVNFKEKLIAHLGDLVESNARMANVLEENACKEDPIEKIKLARANIMLATFKDRLVELGDQAYVKWSESQFDLSFEDIIDKDQLQLDL